MPDQVYWASPITRHRRTREEIAAIERLILGIVAAEHPMTLRGLFYRLVAAGAIAKAEREYRNVGRYLLAMRRRGGLPYAWIADSTRWQRKPQTFRGLEDALWQTARAYRRPLWEAQDAYVEIWIEKDTLAGVLYGETERWDVPLMVCRGFASENYLHTAAETTRDQDKPAWLYLMTDHDSSGLTHASCARLRRWTAGAAPARCTSGRRDR